jgi:uncharacterized protein YbcV (DUF1398 family)
MDAHVKEVAREMTRASDEEQIAFPAVVKALMEVGIERYHSDLIAGTRTYYLPDGGFEVTQGGKLLAPAQEFSGEGVEQALRTIQRGEIGYRKFCKRIACAGCAGYFVSLAGRRALYYGRTNDYFIEWFPGAKS